MGFHKAGEARRNCRFCPGTAPPGGCVMRPAGRVLAPGALWGLQVEAAVWCMKGYHVSSWERAPDRTMQMQTGTSTWIRYVV